MSAERICPRKIFNGTLFFVKTLPGKSPLKTTPASNPPKGNPPDLKTKVDVSKVDVTPRSVDFTSIF